jgi:hypothetical protein
MTSDTRQIVALLLGAVGLVTTAFGMLTARRRAAIGGGRASRCGTATTGYVRLEGKVRSVDAPLRSPASGVECVWYRVRASAPDEGWSVSVGPVTAGTLSAGIRRERLFASSAPFWIEDDTGRVLIDTAGLEVQLAGTSHFNVRLGPDLDQSARVDSERVLAVGESICAIGELSVGGATVSEKVSAILKEWKQDPDALLQRFDANRDGRVDEAEWQAARDAARAEAREALKKAGPTRVLARSKDGRPFVVSATSHGVGLDQSLKREVLIC